MPLVSGSRGKGNDADQVIDYAVSFNNLAQFNETPKASRAKVAAHIGAAPEEVALVRTTDWTSEGGDEIVIWEQNQVTNNEAWDTRAKHFGQKIVRVAVPPVPGSDERVVELLANACSEHTKVLTFT